MQSKISQILYSILKHSKLNQGLDNQLKSYKLKRQFNQKPSRSMRKTYLSDKKTILGKEVYTFERKDASNHTRILYLHGGAYIRGLGGMHYQFIKTLLKMEDYSIMVPDYPLLPNANIDEIYQFLTKCYIELKVQYPSEKIIIMGDSAGGGLALGLSQRLVEENIGSNHHLILLSPWLDVSMSDERIGAIQPNDPILKQDTLKRIGQMLASESDPKSKEVSPLYGNLDGIKNIYLWTGTYDILYVDSLRLVELAKKNNVNYQLYEYEKMLHTWMYFGLPESLQAIKEIINHINSK